MRALELQLALVRLSGDKDAQVDMLIAIAAAAYRRDVIDVDRFEEVVEAILRDQRSVAIMDGVPIILSTAHRAVMAGVSSLNDERPFPTLPS